MIPEIELSGHDINKFIVDINGKDLVVAIGCSWTRFWGAFDDCEDFRSPNYKDNIDLFNTYSYTGIVSNFLNINSKIVMAIPGSNNDMQSRLLVEFMQKNRHKFNQIFVLWGITSHLRWELYSNNVNQPSMFMLGSKVPPGKEEERKWFLTRHWNEKFELERLSQKLVLVSNYLKTLNVEHLFFPVFESYNNFNMNLNYIDNKHFFNKSDSVNDMMHLWCKEHNINIEDSVLANPYNENEVRKLKVLIDLGYLSKASAHPTIKGHKDIADRLVNYINKF